MFYSFRDDDVQIVDPPPIPRIILSSGVTDNEKESTSSESRSSGSTSAMSGSCGSTSASSGSTSVEGDQTQIDKQDLGQQPTLDNLLSMFVGDLKSKEITTVYHLADDDFDSAVDCLLSGPSLDGLLKLHKKKFDGKPASKLHVDADDIWADTVGYYKSPCLKLDKPIRVIFDGSPALDTGGVRRQVFSDVYKLFTENKHAKLFEGPPHFLRPICSAESRSSGLLKVLGTMIAHTITQDGLGFPYLSPLCYWYLVAGEEGALDHLTLADVGTDVRSLVTKVLCVVTFLNIWQTEIRSI